MYGSSLLMKIEALEAEREIQSLEAQREALLAHGNRLTTHIRAWRVTAWVLAVLCVILAAVAVHQFNRLQWRAKVSEAGLQIRRELESDYGAALDELYAAHQFIEGMQSQLQDAEQRIAALESRPGEERFLACRDANQGLVEGIREQQQLISDAIDALAQCGTREGVTYAAR